MFRSATGAVGLLAVVAAAAALGSPQAAPPAQQPAFRAGVETVAVYATVQDADGRLVPNLTREDFEIRDNGQPAEITTFSSDPVPITVVLLLDMSGSMGREFLNVRRATGHFFSTLLSDDRVRLGTFGLEIALSPLLTGDRDVLDRILDEEVWPDGPTPLWAAMRDGMRSLAAAFADVAAELHHQYSIGFTPAARDGRTHRLEVRVLRTGLTARARQSYRAPGGGAP